MPTETQQWYLMNRPLYNSGYENDEFSAYGVDGFNELLESVIAETVYIYHKTIAGYPTEVRAIIQNNTNDVFNSTFIRQILCPIGTVRCGDYVFVNDAYWLVVGYPDNNLMYEKALLYKCRYTINFLSKLTGRIVSYPIYDINSTQYGTGEWKKDNLVIGEDQHLILIPFNPETLLCDVQFRFLMDKNYENPTCYRITRADTTSYGIGSESYDDGLIQWSIIETQFNPRTDNKDLMIADYWTDDIGGEDSQGSGVAKIELSDPDGDFMISVGDTKTFNILYYDEYGDETDPFDYSIEFDNDGSVSLVSNDENTIVLKAEYDKANVGKKLSLRVFNDNIQCESVISFTITNW